MLAENPAGIEKGVCQMSSESGLCQESISQDASGSTDDVLIWLIVSVPLKVLLKLLIWILCSF